MVFLALRKADMKAMKRLGALGGKQRRMFPWSRLKVNVDTVAKAWALEEQRAVRPDVM